MQRLQMAAATALTIAMLIAGTVSSATAADNDHGYNNSGNSSTAHACVNPAGQVRGWCKNNTTCNNGTNDRNDRYNCNGYNNGYNRGLPNGSYLSSCVNATIRASVLSASCTNTSGQRIYSSLNVTRCTGYGRDIGNVNGRLHCV